ncbi:MAG: UDP-N-acetylmuramoylalanine--D-glutamate ligase [Cryomorphaceae bacterium]|jgi:UDP-N-acetylmuramoylalanine--D-glutamate ligase
MFMDPKNTTKDLTENPLVRSRMKALLTERPFSLEPAGMIKGVTFVNDSAATNAMAVIESLSHFEEPIVWITEANDPGFELDDYTELLRDKVKAVVVYGEHTARWHDALWDYLGFFVKANSWDETIELSLEIAKANDTVIFSPGCRASEPFSNFRERGAYFNQLLKIKANAKG